MSIEFGIYPLTGILLAGLLYGVYRLLIRMRCHPRTSQWYIVAAVSVTLLATFMQPVRYVEREAVWTESEESVAGAHADGAEKKAETSKQLPVIYHQATKPSASRSEAKPFFSTNVFASEAFPLIRTVFYAGVAVMLLFFIVQMLWLVRIRQRSTHMDMEKGVRVYDTDVPAAFSFGNSIFMPMKIDGSVRDDVFLHESRHLAHHHYRKLCLMQLLQSVLWFNPFVWLFSHEHKLQQEMEVDQDVMDSGRDREQYQMNLLRMCLKNSSWVQIMPAFGSSVIKRRILFMNRWKPSRFATLRTASSFLLILLFMAATAFATFHTKPEKTPLEGCWEIEWAKNTGSPYEETPFLKNNQFCGNGMQMNFSWYSRYNGVNMNFNFSGLPVTFRSGKFYDYNGKKMNITMLDADTYLYEWTRTPEMTAMQSGPNITEKWHRTAPDSGVLRILKALSDAEKDKSRMLCGVWKEEPDTIQYQEHYLTVSNGIYSRFTIFSDPKSYWCSAGGWCGDIRFESDDRVFVGDRYENVEWHTKDSMTLVIPRENGVIERHVYRRHSELPERFRLCLTAADGIK